MEVYINHNTEYRFRYKPHFILLIYSKAYTKISFYTLRSFAFFSYFCRNKLFERIYMKKLMLSLAMCIAGSTAMASTPLWLRDVSISPSGQEILFCYKGDIYKVPATGGRAIQLTTTASYEANPIWSKDSKQIAFASDRFGGFDVMIMSSEGGSARRLTTNSASELPTAFTPDGKYVLYNAVLQDPAQSVLYPSGAMTEVYSVPVEGGRTQQFLATPAEMIAYDKSGQKLLYQDRKGGENEWRKHHTSSITRDIWIYDVKTKKHTNLTNRPGEDRNPVWGNDGQFYFLSERDKGSFNVYTASVENPTQATAVTQFKTHPVRFLSIAQNGTLCYTYDGEIYTQAKGGKPTKIAISLTRDDENIPTRLRMSRGASSAAVSPDGKQIAFIVRGNVFVTSVEYGTTKQITDTPEAESSVSFGADNRSIVYASERGGNWGLYMATIARKEDPNFPNATQIKEEALLPSNSIERTMPQFSPDGKEVAFIENRNELKVMNLKSKAVRQITDGSTWFGTNGGFHYAWSPDGKWFTLEIIGNKHDPYSDIGLVAADGKGKVLNLTNTGYFSSSPIWVMGGNAILFHTDKYGMRNHASWGSMEDVMLVFMNQDAYDKYRLNKEDYELLKELEKEQAKAKKEEKKDDKKEKNTEKEKEDKSIKVEIDGIEDRMVRLTMNSSNLASSIITPDGETLYYLSSFEGGYDMWKTSLRKRETKLLHKLNTSWAGMELDKSGKTLFLLGSSFQKMDVSGERMKAISFSVNMPLDLAAERAAQFEHVYKQIKKRFYVTNLHGVDWERMTKDYRKFLPHIDNNYDFTEMLSEYLGELNVSHTGSGYRKAFTGDATATLGLLFDWDYKGKGLKVAEVLEDGPFDRKSSQVKAGDILTSINGTEIAENTDVYALLNGLVGQKTLFGFKGEKGNTWEEVIKPISAGAQSGLLYKRWVKQRAEDVKRWSNGRLGYVHIESMADDSFREVYADILGKYNHCEGIVIDTRFNGGGRLHEDIEILFSGKKYFTQVVRGNEACDMPSRRWNKPSIMVQCEANYSNAHGTPWVYKHRGIGKLVGAPVPGTMTSVNWETMQDASMYFGIPVVGYRLPDGSYLENQELNPDILILNTPEEVVKGEDAQLRKAVEVLLKDLK